MKCDRCGGETRKVRMAHPIFAVWWEEQKCINDNCNESNYNTYLTDGDKFDDGTVYKEKEHE